jgi:hypothetical protein
MATSSTATAVRRLATKLAPSSTISVSGMLVFFFLRGKRFFVVHLAWMLAKSENYFSSSDLHLEI